MRLICADLQNRASRGDLPVLTRFGENYLRAHALREINCTRTLWGELPELTYFGKKLPALARFGENYLCSRASDKITCTRKELGEHDLYLVLNTPRGNLSVFNAICGKNEL